QGPYAEDWVRDGSFIDHMLDENGFQDLVTRHELFYVRTQSSPTHPIASVPFGNWPMVMYPSRGGPGGPIPYETLPACSRVPRPQVRGAAIRSRSRPPTLSDRRTRASLSRCRPLPGRVSKRSAPPPHGTAAP